MNGAQSPTKPQTAGELSLQVACHEWLLAIDTVRVERIVLEEELVPRADPRAGAPRAFLGVVRREQKEYAAWDLGELLGRESERRAWVLARLGDGTPIALRTGACRWVGRVADARLSRLPDGLCAGGRRPYRGSFLPNDRRTAVGGLVLDLEALFLPDERAWSRTATHAKPKRGER
ncbi:MAG: hypothetical protein L6Q99_04035 [Planctomycetes bacterium]|nr:hypothetical protein [Planctomycetota bacterium]